MPVNQELGVVMSFWNFTRKKYLIKPAFQLRLALTIFVYVVIYSALFGFIIFFPLYTKFQGSSSFEEQVRISEIALYLHKRVWPALFIMAGLAGIHAIFYSHRLVGPVYRFERMLDALIAGDYSIRIRIRKRDELREMEALLNRLAETLEVIKNDDLKLHSDLNSKLETIKAMGDAPGAGRQDEVRNAVQGLIDDLGRAG
jgi:HAMP domain-containing protein